MPAADPDDPVVAVVHEEFHEAFAEVDHVRLGGALGLFSEDFGFCSGQVLHRHFRVFLVRDERMRGDAGLGANFVPLRLAVVLL